MSKYYGVYELSLGWCSAGMIRLQNKFLTASSHRTILSERFCGTTNRTASPTDRILGADSRTWFKGDAFPGYFTNGHVFREERKKNLTAIFIYQSSASNTGGKGDRSEFFLLWAAGGLPMRGFAADSGFRPRDRTQRGNPVKGFRSSD